jgi:hypothetical protein
MSAGGSWNSQRSLRDEPDIESCKWTPRHGLIFVRGYDTTRADVTRSFQRLCGVTKRLPDCVLTEPVGEVPKRAEMSLGGEKIVCAWIRACYVGHLPHGAGGIVLMWGKGPQVREE